MRKVWIIALLLFFVAIVALYTSNITRQSVSMALQLQSSNGNLIYDNEVLTIDGQITKLPFKKPTIQGTVTIKDKVWKLNRYDESETQSILGSGFPSQDVVSVYTIKTADTDLFLVKFSQIVDYSGQTTWYDGLPVK